MRIAITDYSGHPFQVRLSRELARRGHEVLHLHFADFLTPKGRLSVGPDDPSTLQIEAIKLDKPFAKYSLLQRRFQEVAVGKRIAQRIDTFGPDVVIGCNLPLDALDQLVRHCRSRNWPFVFWQQDVYSLAITRILAKKMGPLGQLVGWFYRRIERRALLQSAAVVVIANEFVDALRDHFGLSLGNVHVIENWAPLDEIEPRPRNNAWRHQHHLDDSDVVLYTGTLGLKHDASKLLSLAQALRTRPRSALVVASEGPSADWLAGEAQRNSLTNLVVLPFQPFDVYQDVLGSADVLIALLEADAGSFSVPSKVLSYLCAGRSIVVSAPRENLAFRIVERAKAGHAVSSDETAAFIEAVKQLLDDAQSRQAAAAAARAYAEKHFDIVSIGDRFEPILLALVS